MQKKLLSFFLFLPLLVCAFSAPISAHPGGTDANGGHIDHSTGEYHYHHGYPAHQHDGGQCPYDFDDKTGQASGLNSGSNAGVKPVTKSAGVEQNNFVDDDTQSSAYQDDTEKPHTKKNYGYYFILGGAVFLAYKGWNYKKKQEEEREEKKRVEAVRKENWLAKYAGKDIAKLAKMPEDAYFVEGLPATRGKTKYGNYTVYVAPTGKCFHQLSTCGGARNLICSNYALNYNRLPCKKCVKGIPEIQWYKDYMKILSEKKELQITDEDVRIYIEGKNS